MPLLRFENVSKQFNDGYLALNEVSFELADGEMVFVTGHSGAGKSTVLKLIHLIERPSRGTVFFAERNLARVRGHQIPLHRRNIGVVYQNHCLLMDRSVGENVALPLRMRGTRRFEIAKLVRAALEPLGLMNRARAFPSQLSSGEQQRVAIARATVASPRLVVADEPTGNLDPTLAAEVMQLFTQLSARGSSIMVVSHDLALLKRMRKRVLVLDHGRLVDDIAPGDLAE